MAQHLFFKRFRHDLDRCDLELAIGGKLAENNRAVLITNKHTRLRLSRFSLKVVKWYRDRNKNRRGAQIMMISIYSAKQMSLLNVKIIELKI